MKSLAVAISFVVIPLVPANAAVAKAGGICPKLNSSSTVNGYKFTCIKSGKKLVWSKGVKVVAKPTPTPTPTPEKTNATLWEKYEWSKPSTSLEVSQAATNKFLTYVATERNPSMEVKVVAQAGVDPLLTSWVERGANLVAKAFEYPKLSRPFVDVIAIDLSWLEATYVKEGYSAAEVKDRLGGFDQGAPAFGGSISNTWNYATIQKNDAMVKNKSGMAQTAGHEFFHAIQERLAGRNPGPDGATIPNWIWEGPAMFIGLQASSKLGIVDYLTVGQRTMVDRYKYDSEAMKKLPLSEVKKNDKDSDPYGLGEVATEFIVANVGIEKLLGVYAALGQGKSFAQAFEAGIGVKLDDFYSMFEESRATLGFPLGLSASAAASPSPAPSATPQATQTPSPTVSASTKSAGVKLTLEEVKKHGSGTSCWSVVYGNVFDLTNWISKHPGGAAVIRAICGKDGTDAFEGQHAGEGKPASQLSNYFLGKLGDSVKT